MMLAAFAIVTTGTRLDAAILFRLITLIEFLYIILSELFIEGEERMGSSKLKKLPFKHSSRLLVPGVQNYSESDVPCSKKSV